MADAVGVGLLLVVALGVDYVTPETGEEVLLSAGVAPVDEVFEVDEQPVAAATNRAAMARRFMVRVWCTCLIP